MKSVLFASLCMICTSAAASDLDSLLAKSTEGEFRLAMDASWKQTGDGVYSRTLTDGRSLEVAFGDGAVERQLDSLEVTRSKLLDAAANPASKADAGSIRNSLVQVDRAIAAMHEHLAPAPAIEKEGAIGYYDHVDMCNENSVGVNTHFEASFNFLATGLAAAEAYAFGSGLVARVTVTTSASNSAWNNLNTIPNVALYADDIVGTSSDIGGDWGCNLATSVTIAPPRFCSLPLRAISYSHTCSEVAFP